MYIFKKILKILFTLASLVGVLWAVQWVKENREAVLKKVQQVVDVPLLSKTVTEKNLPPETDPKEVTFTWQYAGKDYELKKNLYASTFFFFQKSPKSYNYQSELPVNWEDEYYALFFMTPIGDNSIPEVANEIKTLGEKNRLSEDQLVELVLAFVQKLAYEDAKANAILTGGQESIYYPYETLFVQSGVCSDKSILAASILRQLGYGTALFTYEAEKHMALGIKCPMEYSNNNSGYCYAETTSMGFRIGMIPDFDQNNRVVANQELKNFEQTQTEQFNYKRLGEPKIFQVTDGKSYNGIAKTISIAKEIDGLKIAINNAGKELADWQKKIKNQEKELEGILSDMKKLEKSGKYDEYNDKVDDYNDLAEDYRKSVKKYNALIADYNKKVNRYNSLLKSF